MDEVESLLQDHRKKAAIWSDPMRFWAVSVGPL